MINEINFSGINKINGAPLKEEYSEGAVTEKLSQEVVPELFEKKLKEIKTALIELKQLMKETEELAINTHYKFVNLVKQKIDKSIDLDLYASEKKTILLKKAEIEQARNNYRELSKKLNDEFIICLKTDPGEISKEASGSIDEVKGLLWDILSPDNKDLGGVPTSNLKQ